MLRVAIAVSALAILGGCGMLGASAPETPAAPAALKAMANAADSEAWAKYVPWDSTRPGIVKTGSGVEYVILASGPADGEQPIAASMVEVHYEGRLNADGKPFDSSFDRRETAEFPVDGVIPGFSEALKLMRPGDAWLVYMPASLAYADRSPSPDIPANSDLVFEVELKSVTTPLQSDVAAWSKYTPWNSAGQDVRKTGSGLEYVVLASGPASGSPPKNGQSVEVYFEMRNAEGQLVESSFRNGETVSFPIDALTPGFEEAMKLMRPGDRWLIMMPPRLAADAAGKAPDGPLLVEIALEKVSD